MPRLALTFAAALLGLLLLPPPAWADWLWPLRGEVITPYRNGSDPYASGQHRGIDIAGDLGTPVAAAAAGEVRFAGTAGSSGLTVSVRTADGRYDTSYLHLASIGVRKGDRVEAGTALGTVGTTGTRSSDRPHLHFGVRDAGARHAYHDPLTFLPPPPPAADPPFAPQPQPQPQPQPAPAPLAPAPTPEPVRAPAGRRIPIRAPARRRVPVRRPVPIRAPEHAPARRPAGRPVTAPSRHPAPNALLSPEEHGRARDGNAPTSAAISGTPAHNPATGTAATERGRSARPTATLEPGPPATVRQPASLPPAPSGPDLGLLLACLGLVAAAAVLGLTGEGRRTTSRTAKRLTRIVEPLLGRR